MVVLLLTMRLCLTGSPDLTKDSEAQLVQDVWELRYGQGRRPTHVASPLPGTFGELAEAHLAALELSRKRLGKEAEAEVAVRRAVERGQKPTSILPIAWKQELAATTPALSGVLEATHAAGSRVPFPLSVFHVLGADDSRFSFLTVQYAAKLAALRARVQLESGDADSAARTCVDALGMARDIASADFLGQMVAHAMVKIMEPVCRDSGREVPSGERGIFRQSVARILAGWPTLRSTLGAERVFGQLAFFSDQLSASTRAVLPPEARLMTIRNSHGLVERAQLRLFGGWARDKYLQQMAALVDAERLPPSEADLEVDRISDRPFVFALAGMGGGDKPSWVPLFRFVRETLAYLVRLEVITHLWQFRADSGRWPVGWSEAGVRPPVDPRTGRFLSMQADAETVVVTFPSDGPRTADNLDLKLSESLP